MLRRLFTVVVFAGFSVGCESETTGPQPLVEGELTLDASATDRYTYLNLETGQVVAVADPSTSSDWDLAFRRFEVRLNGGVRGPGDVSGYNVANNAGATAAEVLAFTPANQLPAFEAVTVAQIPGAASFTSEELAATPTAWLSFGATGPAANPSVGWKVKRASNGGHAVFRATGLTFGGGQQGAALTTATIEWRYQAAGGALGARQTATLSLAAGTPAVNFATGALTAGGAGCDWDLVAQASFALAPNAACGAGTFPLSAAESFDGVGSAANAIEYGAFLAGTEGPVPFSAELDDPRGPFLYNLAGDNRLSPTFNIFLLRVGNAVYKVQLTGYYSATGAGGHVTVRYAQLQ